jgi:protein O-GlcNAc transferase
MRIAFFCHATNAGRWSPESLARGVGGSEEAVVHMSSQLAARGHVVSVHFAKPGRSRWFGPVEYADYDRLRGETVHIGILWRRISMIDHIYARDLAVRRLYLWLHDNVSLENVMANHGHFHKLMVLSRYHRSRFPDLPDDRFFITSNGIDTAQFEPPDPPRDPFLMVYGSDYVRGLRALLRSWPEIKSAVPRARLRVFYGWQGIEHRNPTRAARLQGDLGPLLLQDGIVHLGRISYAAVASEYRRAGIWAYPCSYRETSCISAMKAQAGGAVPAVIPNGALRETVRFGFRTRSTYDELSGGMSERPLVEEWRDGVIDLLRSPERQAQIRREMVPASKAAFAWAHVADAWNREFLSATT